MIECDEKSSLSIIAAEYGDTDSDVEEIEATTPTENQYTVSQIQTQNLQQYRTVEQNSREDDSNSSVNSSSNSSSSSSSNSDNSSDSDSDDIANIKYYYLSIKITL